MINFLFTLFSCINFIAKRLRFTMIALSNEFMITRKQLNIPKTIIIEYDEKNISNKPKALKNNNIILMNMTTEECIVYCHNNNIGKHTVVLNFASGVVPGGSYLTGAMTQEEELCRAFPQLFRSLYRTNYPHKINSVLITPHIEMIKYNIIVSIVSCAAPDLNKEPLSLDRIEKTLSNMYVSVKKFLPETDTLILGAWGCGAFKNDPKIISNIMNNLNKKNKYYENIIFAIPKTKSIYDNNYDIFDMNIERS